MDVFQERRDAAPVSEVKKQGPYFGVGGMAIPFWGWALAINIVSTHILLIPHQVKGIVISSLSLSSVGITSLSGSEVAKTLPFRVDHFGALGLFVVRRSKMI